VRNLAAWSKVLGKVDFALEVASVGVALGGLRGVGPPDGGADVVDGLVPCDLLARRGGLVVEPDAASELDHNGVGVGDDVKDGGFTAFDSDEAWEDAAASVAERTRESELLRW